MAQYECYKCGHKSEFLMLAGEPLSKIPCKCGSMMIFAGMRELTSEEEKRMEDL